MPRDRSGSAPVAIINETFARQYFHGRTAIGSRMRLDDGEKVPREVQIVGVVGDVRHFGLEKEATIEVYVPIGQVPDPTTIWLANNMYWVVQTDGAPLAAANAVRREIAAVDPAVPASFVRSMDQWIGGTLAARRFNLQLVGAFAAAALLLAVVGVYAVSAFGVTVTDAGDRHPGRARRIAPRRDWPRAAQQRVTGAGRAGGGDGRRDRAGAGAVGNAVRRDAPRWDIARHQPRRHLPVPHFSPTSFPLDAPPGSTRSSPFASSEGGVRSCFLQQCHLEMTSDRLDDCRRSESWNPD